MLKIGILTYFSSINNGAFLQAWCMQEFLKNRYGDKANICMINYSSQKSDESYKIYNVQKRQKFYDCWKILDLTADGIVTDDICEISEYIISLNLDVIIVGSDEVWKTDGLRGFPNAYWVNYDIGRAIRVAYAVSGRNNYQLMDNQSIKYIKEAISKFSYLGVRDDVTKKELLGIDQVEISRNCDPTILYRQKLRFTEDEKRKLCDKWNKSGKKLVVLMVADKCLANQLYRMLRNEYLVYDIFEEGRLTDEQVFALSPFEWSELIATADCVITSLFHGTVFSLIHDTPFISVELAEKGRGKIENILREHDLEENMICKADYPNSLVGMGMDIYSLCKKKILCSKENSSYETILLNEAEKSLSFVLHMDFLIESMGI